MCRLLLIAGALLALPAAVAADSVPQLPGKKFVPQDVILEVGEEVRNYRFWWLPSLGGMELTPLPLAPGKPYRISQETYNGRRFYGTVVAVPNALLEQMGEDKVVHALKNETRLPGVLRCHETIELAEHISTYDSRERVVLRYRVEIPAGKPMQLVFLGDNSHENTGYSGWLGGAVAVAGVFLSGLAMWFGWRIARRRQTQPATR